MDTTRFRTPPGKKVITLKIVKSGAIKKTLEEINLPHKAKPYFLDEDVTSGIQKTEKKNCNIMRWWYTSITYPILSKERKRE